MRQVVCIIALLPASSLLILIIQFILVLVIFSSFSLSLDFGDAEQVIDDYSRGVEQEKVEQGDWGSREGEAQHRREYNRG